MATSKNFVCLFAAIFFVILGIIIWIAFPRLYWNAVYQKLILSPESETYPFWKDMPIPIYLRIYLYNITNPLTFLNGNQPILEEVGPYTYREERHKINIKWNNNGTVSYQQIKRWYFEPSMSNGSLNDYIITLNVPMIITISLVKQKKPSFLQLLLILLKVTHNDLMISKSVEELLFVGYTDNLIQIAYRMNFYSSRKFGWFFDKNNTDDGTYTIFTGSSNINYLGLIEKWNRLKTMDKWSPPYNSIKVSAGDFWFPSKKSFNSITLFSSELVKTLSLYYSSKKEIHGIETSRYFGTAETLSNEKFEHKYSCRIRDSPYGTFSFKNNLKISVPILLSYPHFLHADPTCLENVIGLKPDSKIHQSYMDLLTDLGLPLNVAIKFQMNLILEDISKISKFSNLQNIKYFPIIWFDEEFTINDEIANRLKFVLNTLPFIARCCAGCFLLFGMIHFLLFIYKNKVQKKQYINI